MKRNNNFEDGIRVLGYGDFSKMEMMMSRHFLEQITEVSDEITESPRTIENLNEYLREGEFTHLFIPDENFHRLNGTLENCCVPVIELLEDHWVFWAIERKKNYLIQNGIKHTIVFTERFLEPYKSVSNFYPLTTGFSDKRFFDRNLKKDIDVLISGRVRLDEFSWVYPVRKWFVEVLPNIANKEGLKLEFWKHPGYFPGRENNQEEQYSNILNRAKIATGGSSYWRLPLKKLYEIPSCGAILMSDLPFDDTDFFKGRIIEVNPNSLQSRNYEDDLRRMIVNTLENYDSKREILQPFRKNKDRFDRSYVGKAIEMRKIISGIKS